MTKVDEAEQFAGCLHAAFAANLPVTYLCDGARVPEDIHDASLDAILDSLFPELA
jgi:flagellar biosynthesis GTPase FlhF